MSSRYYVTIIYHYTTYDSFLNNNFLINNSVNMNYENVIVTLLRVPFTTPAWVSYLCRNRACIMAIVLAADYY